MAGGTDRFGDLLQRVAQGSQVHVAVDAAELLAGLDHPRGAPAQRHGAVLPALDVAGMLPADQVNGQIFNIATGQSTSLLAMIEILKEQFPEYTQSIKFQPARAGDIRHSYAACTKFNKLLEPSA